MDSPSQGYYSNELKTETKPIETKPGTETTLEPPICLGCIEPEYSTQKSTFMCFSWRKKPKTRKKFIKPKSDEDSDLEDRQMKKYMAKFEKDYEDELQDQKQMYKKHLTKRDDEIEKFKKQCEDYISTKEQEIIDLQNNSTKELKEHKRIISETENHYQNQMKLLSEKIKSMENNDASFKPLSDIIFNCITIEEIF